MHYSKHRLTASVSTRLRARRRQPITNGLALLAHWSVRQKLNRCQFSSVTSLCMRAFNGAHVLLTDLVVGQQSTMTRG